jgi:hypothetical protein
MSRVMVAGGSKRDMMKLEIILYVYHENLIYVGMNSFYVFILNDQNEVVIDGCREKVFQN